MEQNAGFFLLLFSPLTPFKQINVAPLLSLLKDRQHIFWVDTGDLASFHNREEQVKSKTFWCRASREWMLAMYFCRASSLRLSMFRKRFVWRLPSKAYQPKGMLTCYQCFITPLSHRQIRSSGTSCSRMIAHVYHFFLQQAFGFCVTENHFTVYYYPPVRFHWLHVSMVWSLLSVG